VHAGDALGGWRSKQRKSPIVPARGSIHYLLFSEIAHMPHVLTINGGSSSIRFAIHEAARVPTRMVVGKLDRIGTGEALLYIDERSAGKPDVYKVSGIDAGAAVAILLERLEALTAFTAVAGVGHRIVHGMSRGEPELVTPQLTAALRGIAPYDPEHMPLEIDLIEAFARRHPQLPQVACFDTAFHRTMPRVATLLPIPRRYMHNGVQRYGFHGLSYTYVLGELARIGDPAAVSGRAVLAHLGGGASMAAILNGASIDTSMGFTPAAGLMMGTRSGDVDPGLLGYLSRTHSLGAQQLQAMLTLESGLLGVSETSADVRDLLARESSDVRAAEALALFCYTAKQRIGAYAAALGGLDTIVFTGGIGENAPLIRGRICEGLQFLGIDLDARLNLANAPLISKNSASVAVRVIRTDEEVVIAKLTMGVLGLTH
jgi:acetate kinase